MQKHLIVALVGVVLALLLAMVSPATVSAAGAAFSWNATRQVIALRYDAASDKFKVFDVTATVNSSAAAAGQTGDPSFGVFVSKLDITRSGRTNGWDMVDVAASDDLMSASASNTNANASLGFYGMAYVEAYYTWDSIADSWHNWGALVQSDADATTYNKNWIEQNIAYLKGFDIASTDRFDSQVAKFMRWLDGLVKGYNDARDLMIARGVPGAAESVALSHYQLFLLQFQDEVGDVNQSNTAYNASQQADGCPLSQLADEHALKMRGREHCSVLFKMTADDIIVSHITWSHYRTMLRQYKTYHFGAPSTNGGVSSLSFSSYPGSLWSSDDWYTTSQRLIVTETTNNNFNASMAQNYVKPHTVPCFMRVFVANVLATTTQEWMDFFLKGNSGTYVNMWMVIDMKTVALSTIAARTLPAGTFRIIEAMPGPYSVQRDMTAFLNQETYWSSFNRNYFNETRASSCGAWYAATYGPVWGYYDYCRYLIFKERQGSVKDIASMKRMMRYNDWQNDVYSTIPWCAACNPSRGPSLSIAARYDLIPPTQDYSNASIPIRNYLKTAYDGAIDAKISSFKLFATSSSVTSHIINGPTNDQQPTFSWLNGTIPLGSDNNHRNQPDVFNFPWVAATTTLLGGAGGVTKPKTQPSWTIVIVAACVVGGVFLFVVIYKTFFAADEPAMVKETLNGGKGEARAVAGSDSKYLPAAAEIEDKPSSTTSQPLMST